MVQFRESNGEKKYITLIRSGSSEENSIRHVRHCSSANDMLRGSRQWERLQSLALGNCLIGVMFAELYGNLNKSAVIQIAGAGP